jgi:uncharacterized membrane protein
MLLLAACGGESVDSAKGAGTTDSASAVCVTDTGGGYPTWSGFGEAFFAGRCASCHAATAPDRFGAPEAVSFDTEEQVVRLLDSVQRVILDDASMPPGGGLHEDELRELQWYLDCLRAR